MDCLCADTRVQAPLQTQIVTCSLEVPTHTCLTSVSIRIRPMPASLLSPVPTSSPHLMPGQMSGHQAWLLSFSDTPTSHLLEEPRIRPPSDLHIPHPSPSHHFGSWITTPMSSGILLLLPWPPSDHSHTAAGGGAVLLQPKTDPSLFHSEPCISPASLRVKSQVLAVFDQDPRVWPGIPLATWLHLCSANLQPPCPPCCSLTLPNAVMPQGLCTFCPCCPGLSFPG